MDLQTQLLARDPIADEAALSARLEAFRDLEQRVGDRPIEHEHEQLPWPAREQIPEVAADELNVTVLKRAIATHGSLIVRGFLSAGETASCRGVVDRVVDLCRAQETSNGDPTCPRSAYRNPPRCIQSLLVGERLKNSRGFHRQSGSAMVVEAASVAEQLLALYGQKQLNTILEAYLGEKPCLSALKWVLRRSKLPVQPAGWHQDGAFMGADINSINMWIPLDHCGAATGAPGLDVVPRRMREVFRPGADKAYFNWSIAEDDITEAFGSDAVCSPEFFAGDAYFFDHFFLHRTQFREDYTRPRYAIETWFFGNRNFPKNQVPLAW